MHSLIKSLRNLERMHTWSFGKKRPTNVVATLSHSHIIYLIKMSLLGFPGTAVKETGATFFLQISWFISITHMSTYKNVFMYFLPL